MCRPACSGERLIVTLSKGMNLTKDTIPRRLGRVLRGGVLPFLLAVALFLSAETVRAAGRFAISLGYGTARMGRYGSGWGNGFEAGLLIRLWGNGGIHASGILSSDSNDISDGIVADAGFWKSFGSDRAPSILLIGGSVIAGSDSDGGTLGGGGIHAGFRQEIWLGSGFGLYGRGVLRYWFSRREQPDFTPSVSGGVCLRF
jgi:hypothetical protein